MVFLFFGSFLSGSHMPNKQCACVLVSVHGVHAAVCAGPSAQPSSSNEDGEDDVVVTAELDMEAVLQRRRAAAIANGDMVDLAADIDEAAMDAAAAAMAADVEAANRENARRFREARLQRFRDRMVRTCSVHPQLL